MKRSAFAVWLVFLIFFVISLVTNILGSIIPNIIEDFGLSLFVGSLVTFSFFIAYGVMSIPAGVFLERFRERPVLVASFVLVFVGSLAFAAMPRFGVMLPSLFLIGAAFAMLQVAINPLLRVAGGEENFAFNSAAAQGIFGLASFLSPWLYAYLVQGLQADEPANGLIAALSRVVPESLPWVSLYWVFAVICLVMLAGGGDGPPAGGRAPGGRAGGGGGDLQGAPPQARGLALLPRDLHVRGDGAGRGQLDLEVPRDLSRLRAGGGRQDRGLSLLGAHDRGLLPGPDPPEALRQPARPRRLLGGGHAGPRPGALRPGPGVAVGLPARSASVSR